MLTIAILTPLSLERHAVMSFITNWQEELVEGNLYYTAFFQGNHHPFKIIVHQTGSKNNTITFATERIIQIFQPNILLLTGIAGGVKDVTIGDVVIGTKAYGYDSGKEQVNGFVSRPEVYHCSKDLVTLAQLVSNQNKWQKRIKTASNFGAVFFGPIAAGDKVIATIKAQTYQHLKTHYNDTIALEMEAYGVGQAMLNHPNIRWLNIRGISDLLEGKNSTEDIDNQPIAASHAAAFLFEFLYQLDASKLNLPIMNAKELSKAIFQILFPVSRLESVQDIQKDLGEATNTSVRELWKKVRPLFIEEFEELQADPTDTDVHGSIRSKIKRAIDKESSGVSKTELEGLVQTILKKENQEASTHIQDSENVIVGSTISAGGDFNMGNTTTTTNHYGHQGDVGTQHNILGNSGSVHVGDVIHIHQIMESKASNSIGQHVTTSVHDIQSMIAKGRIKNAIEALLALSKSKDTDTQHQAIVLASRWNSLSSKINMRTIRESSANIEQNKILMGVMSVLEEM